MTYDPYDHFCFIHFKEEFVPSLDLLVKTLPEQCRQPAEAFRRNLRATALTATIPYQMAFGSLWRRNWEFTLLEEKIKHGRNTHERAMKKFLKEMQSEKKRDLHSKYLLSVFKEDLQNEEIRFAAAELIRQCTVQCWSTFEVFVSDTFVSLLNAKPSLAITLMKDEKSKKLFQLKGIPFEVLAEHKYNLASTMGVLLAGYHPVDSLPSMKAVLGALLPNRKAINRALSHRELWLLFQRRHLIVHRRGIVDSSYISATGEKVALGSEILISPDALETYFKSVLRAGTVIGAGVVAEFGAP